MTHRQPNDLFILVQNMPQYVITYQVVKTVSGEEGKTRLCICWRNELFAYLITLSKECRDCHAGLVLLPLAFSLHC